MTRPCAICGSSQNLTDHHIHPRCYSESYPNGMENISEPANIVLLCRGCHDCVHNKKPLHIIVKDIKQRLRRPHKPRKYKTEEQREQGLKDLAKLTETYKRLIHTLDDPYKRSQIENYRRIISTIERLHLRILGKK